MSGTGRPLLLVDVDFVLNPDFTGRWDGPEGDALREAGWVVIGGFIFNDRPVWLNRFHGLKLMHAALATGAELAWATRWHGVANQVVSPLLGLPQMPVIPFPRTGKAEAVVPWTQGRPFAWLDDEPGLAETTGRLAGDQPHLVVRVDERTGLTDENISAGAGMAAERCRSLTTVTRWPPVAHKVRPSRSHCSRMACVVFLGCRVGGFYAAGDFAEAVVEPLVECGVAYDRAAGGAVRADVDHGVSCSGGMGCCWAMRTLRDMLVAR